MKKYIYEPNIYVHFGFVVGVSFIGNNYRLHIFLDLFSHYRLCNVTLLGINIVNIELGAIKHSKVNDDTSEPVTISNSSLITRTTIEKTRRRKA